MKVPGDGRGGYLEAADTPITTSTSSGGSSIRKSNGNLWIDNRMGWHNYDENEGEEEDVPSRVEEYFAGNDGSALPAVDEQFRKDAAAAAAGMDIEID